MNWWQRLWNKKELERQLDKELRFHLDQYADDLVARGVEPAEAARQAHMMFGGTEQMKEQCRDARGTRWLEDLWRDLSYALRMLWQKPTFSAIALCTLALGIGSATIMFTLVNSVLLKPLPYKDPSRLVVLHAHTEQFGDQWLPYPNYQDLKRDTHSLTPLGAVVFTTGTVTAPGDAEYADGRMISFDFFSTLGLPLFRGREFLKQEDRPGGTPVIIISYNMWQRRFAASSNAIGSQIVFDAKSYTIVGIAPRAFRWLGNEVDVFTPTGQSTEPYMRNRRAHPVMVVGRLRPGAVLTEAQAELSLLGQQLEKQYPENRGRTLAVQPLREDVGTARSTLWLLFGAVVLVLLIACVNVASLLLARAVSRERELAMRMALGAGRGRLVRQCLTESAVLGLGGGALGIALAFAGVRPFVAFWPGTLPRAEEVVLDWRVLIFSLFISLLSGLLFGLAPALRAPSRNLEQTLRAGSRSAGGSSRRMHGGFVVAEIALAMVLLIAAGMLGHTVVHLSTLNPGLNTHNVLVTRMALSPATLADTPKIRSAWDDLLNRVGRMPGVETVTMVDTVPMREGNNQLGYWKNSNIPPDNQQPVTLANSVTPDYLKVMGIPLRSGRFFDARDQISSEPVIVIDDVLAAQAFGSTPAIGQRLWVPNMNTEPLKVVGVVGHVRHWGLAGDDGAQVRAQLYYPFAQVPNQLLRRWSELMSIAVRTNLPPLQLVEPLRREVRGATGDQVIYEINTMEHLADDSLSRQRFLLLLFGGFAALALALACIGIYGVLAYLIGQRVPEIGVRMALGASTGQVMWMVLGQSLAMISLGVVVGSAVAVAAGKVLVRLVEGMQPAGISSFAMTLPVMVAAALLASLIPARRATRVDPVRALREE
jgi:predicted permease